MEVELVGPMVVIATGCPFGHRPTYMELQHIPSPLFPAGSGHKSLNYISECLEEQAKLTDDILKLALVTVPRCAQ